MASEPASFGLRLLIVGSLLAHLLIIGWCFLDLWRTDPAIVLLVLGPKSGVDGSAIALRMEVFHSMLFAIVGGGLGGATSALLAFNRHVAFKHDFGRSFAWGFFYAPWIASVLGLMAFALAKAGILVLSGGGVSTAAPEAANLGNLSLGFLAGFGWLPFSQKLNRIINDMFGVTDSTPSPPATTPPSRDVPAN